MTSVAETAAEIEERRAATRRRLRDDFEFWAANAYTIIDKAGTLKKLVLNRAQKRILETIIRQQEAGKPIRIIILKGRQQGASTMIEAWQLWRTSQNKAKRAFVLAHVADSSSGLFEQAKRGYDNLPELLKPLAKRSNKKELVFSKLDSSLEVATAGGKGIGRGKTFQYCHASEVAFWETGSAETNWNGLNQCVPNDPDSFMAVESTANGMGGLFHRLWTDAERGVSEFEAVFVPWFWQDEYEIEAPSGFKRTPEEDMLADDFPELDSNRKLQWRRGKIAAVGLDLFNQEYPNTPTDAFLTSGRPVFETAIVHKLIQQSPEPLRRMGFFEGTFEDDLRGELRLYAEVNAVGSYFIGADVSEGCGGDFSCAQVFDGSGAQVATWSGNKTLPDDFALILYELGMMFNMAEICVEANNHGILTVNELAKKLKYPAVWTDVNYDRVSDEDTVRLGFLQNPKTRTMILNKLRGAVRDSTVTLHDKTTLKEMLAFVVNESGKMTSEAGAHDDHVMALALANHINTGEWKPIINKPEWLIEAI